MNPPHRIPRILRTVPVLALSLAALVIVTANDMVADYAFVAPVGANAIDSYGGYEPVYAIDGSGMTPGNPVVPTSTCSTSGGGTMWSSAGGTEGWISFDLGSVQSFSAFHLWNYNETGYNNCSAKDVDVYYGDYLTFTTAKAGTLAQSFTFAQGPANASYTGEVYTFTTPVAAQYVQVYVNNTWGGGYVGIAEIRFHVDSGPLASIDITNITGSVTIPDTTASIAIAGTNNVYTVGDLWWSSSLGGAGVVLPSPTGWTINVALLPGTNVITVCGSNVAGYVASDMVMVDVVSVSAKDILEFGPGAVIAGTDIAWIVPAGTHVSHLSPTYTVSPLASGVPPSGTTRNFTTPQTYTVTAHDLSTKDYIVTVTTGNVPPVVAGLALWLDASQLAGLANGDQVNTWTDMSGLTNDAIRQTDSSAGYPMYVTNVVNGMPVVRFSGSGKMGVNLSFLAGTSYTIFAIEGKRIAAPGLMYFLGTQDAAANRGLHFGYRNDTDFTLAQYANDLDYVNGSLAYAGQVFRRWVGMLDMSSGHSIYLNGAGVAANANTTPFSSATNGVVGVGFSNASYYNGDIAEIIVFTRALPMNELGAVDAYLSRKYFGGVYITNDPFSVSEGADIVVAGTNSRAIVGDMWISNAANDVVTPFTAPAPTEGWVSPPVASVAGNNPVWVFGTNSDGAVASDVLVVNYVPEPVAAGVAAVIGYSVFGIRRRRP